MPGVATTDRSKPEVRSWTWRNLWIWQIDTLVGTPTFCEACALGKMKKLPFESQEQPHTTRPLEMVHTDVGGPITPRSWEGYRFWIVIVDDFTCFPWVYFMKHKNEALQIYNQWKKDIQTMFRSEVYRLGGPFQILCQMNLQWQRTWICQQGILGPTQNWWNTSWNICPIYAREKWTRRKNEPNIVHSCKHNAWGVQASQILLGWCNGHCCLCYCKKSSLWNWWKYSISSTLQSTGWSHCSSGQLLPSS